MIRQKTLSDGHVPCLTPLAAGRELSSWMTLCRIRQWVTILIEHGGASENLKDWKRYISRNAQVAHTGIGITTSCKKCNLPAIFKGARDRAYNIKGIFYVTFEGKNRRVTCINSIYVILQFHIRSARDIARDLFRNCHAVTENRRREFP